MFRRIGYPAATTVSRFRNHAINTIIGNAHAAFAYTLAPISIVAIVHSSCVVEDLIGICTLIGCVEAERYWWSKRVGNGGMVLQSTA